MTILSVVTEAGVDRYKFHMQTNGGRVFAAIEAAMEDTEAVLARLREETREAVITAAITMDDADYKS